MSSAHYPDPQRRGEQLGATQFLEGEERHRHLRHAAARMCKGIQETLTYAMRFESGHAAAGRHARDRRRHLPRLRAADDGGARALGLAARFITGYLYDPALDEAAGGTASGAIRTPGWRSICRARAGSSSIRPTASSAAERLIRVAVGRDPEQAMPIKGTSPVPPTWRSIRWSMSGAATLVRGGGSPTEVPQLPQARRHLATTHHAIVSSRLCGCRARVRRPPGRMPMNAHSPACRLPCRRCCLRRRSGGRGAEPAARGCADRSRPSTARPRPSPRARARRVKVNLADNWGRHAGRARSTMADIKENSFVGIASLKGPTAR